MLANSVHIATLTVRNHYTPLLACLQIDLINTRSQRGHELEIGRPCNRLFGDGHNGGYNNSGIFDTLWNLMRLAIPVLYVLVREVEGGKFALTRFEVNNFVSHCLGTHGANVKVAG